MDETKKMLRAIINGQSSMKQELLKEVKRVDKKLDEVNGGLSVKIDNVEKRLTGRLDMLGKQLSELDDDAPTGEEFEDLERRVTVVEHKVVLAG